MSEVKTLKSAFFVQMDSSILGLNISLSQKVICGAIYGLSRDEGYCYISNENLAKLLHVTSKSVETHILRLSKAGFIQNMGSKYDRKLIFVSPLHEKIEGSNPQNEGSNPQNEDLIYIIYKRKLKEGQVEDLTLTQKEFYDLTFNSFWSQFPKRVKKQDAKTDFKKLSAEEIDALLEALPAISHYHNKSNHDDHSFIPDCPHPTTFIKGHRWEDEVYLTQKIAKKGAVGSLDSEMEKCVMRFRRLSEGDGVAFEAVDGMVLGLLGFTEQDAMDEINDYSLGKFRKRVATVWNDAQRKTA